MLVPPELFVTDRCFSSPLLELLVLARDGLTLSLLNALRMIGEMILNTLVPNAEA